MSRRKHKSQIDKFESFNHALRGRKIPKIFLFHILVQAITSLKSMKNFPRNISRSFADGEHHKMKSRMLVKGITQDTDVKPDCSLPVAIHSIPTCLAMIANIDMKGALRQMDMPLQD